MIRLADQDMAAKEAKKQRVARQIEKRRQAKIDWQNPTPVPGSGPESGSGPRPSVAAARRRSAAPLHGFTWSWP